MKKTLVFGGCLVVIIAMAGIFILSKISISDSMDNPAAIPPMKLRQPIAMCYSYDHVVSSGYHDKETLTLMIAGEKVTGEYKYQPAEKDSKTGTFEGMVGPMDPKISARTADVWWNVLAEGMQATEQLKIQFGEGSAVAFFGEMKDSEDGRYVYAHPEKLTPGFQMDQKDCATIK